MALDTYTNLKTAIEDELKNDELTNIIPDFITRAEAKINRRARFRAMEALKYTTYDSSNTTRRVALPTDFLEMLNVKQKISTQADSEYKPLEYVGSGRIQEYYDCQDLAYFTLRSDIEFNKLVTDTRTILMHYYKRLDLATDETNYVLTNYPDVYLYGACSEAEIYMRNDNRVPMWKALFQEAIKEINDLDERNRDDSKLEMPYMLKTSSRFNIIRGR